MKVSLMTNIIQFTNNKKIAVVGASAKKKNFGVEVVNELKKRGYEPVVVHREASEIAGAKCYSSVMNLPDDINAIHICTNKKEVKPIFEEVLKKGIGNIWIQQHSESDEVIAFAEGSGKNVIVKQCVLMFAEPVSGFHKFHKSLKKFFGGLPK